MRKTTIATTLSIILLGSAGTAAFAAHPDHLAANGMANMEGMAGMDGMAAGGSAMPMNGMAGMPMPMQGMMPMMQGMMPMMQGMMPMMMGMMPMMMPMGGQPMAGMAGMESTAAAPEAVPAGLEEKLNLLINSIDVLTARIEKLEAPAAN